MHGARTISTLLVHHDRSLYSRRGVAVMTEFDVIETAPGKGGYNCYLNALCGVPENEERAFGLAFGLDAWIDPSEGDPPPGAPHTRTTPWSRSAGTTKWSATNGENHTFHVGAWLGRRAPGGRGDLGGRRLRAPGRRLRSRER